MIRRLLSAFVLAAACGASAGASAQDGPGLFLDPQQLPTDMRPGECVTRRVTGPGGAYRWDRIECEAHAGWGDFDHWGYGRQPLAVVDGPPRGHRHGGWSQGPDHGSEPYQPGYGAPYRVYGVAGRDEGGYLVWPGKAP